MGKLQVIYITGAGRSGTTIVDRVLGTFKGVVSFSEIYRLMTYGLKRNDYCSCGESFTNCPFWNQVSAQIFSDAGHRDRIGFLYDKLDHVRRFPLLFLKAHRSSMAAEVEEYKLWLRRLYFALADISGARVIVDSSKVPIRALLLSGIEDIDVHVLHIVRDVRAVVHAWAKEKHNPAFDGSMPKYGALRTIALWHVLNVYSEFLSLRMPYTRIRYEEFAKQPRAVLEDLQVRIPALPPQPIDFLHGNTVTLKPRHTIGGNPDRFSSGTTQIEPTMRGHPTCALHRVGWPPRWPRRCSFDTVIG
jgi:hypothetical protein